MVAVRFGAGRESRAADSEFPRGNRGSGGAADRRRAEGSRCDQAERRAQENAGRGGQCRVRGTEGDGLHADGGNVETE